MNGRPSLIPWWSLPILALLALALALLLAGCASAPYWQRTRAPVQCDGPVYLTQDQLETLWRSSAPTYNLRGARLNAFVHIRPAEGRGTIYAGPRFNTCAMAHELAHCDGWAHDDRETFRQDCGPEDTK